MTREQDALWQSVRGFLRWLEPHGYASYDPYDVWGSGYGIYARRQFYRRPLLAVPLIAPLVLSEWLPPLHRALAKKTRYAHADAQLILGYVNLFSIGRDPSYLSAAVSLARDLLASSIPGYSGHCWGYPFDWQNNRGLWKAGTPFITVTPDCFEAFLALYDVTQDRAYLDIAESSAQFALKDLQETRLTDEMAACSYSPIDQSMVINANAYRASMLMEAFARFGNQQFKDAALKNVRFVLHHQREDGAWLYAVGNPKDAFIDNFHTCFVLKYLGKLNRHLGDASVASAIQRGYAYYQRALVDERGEPKPFATASRLQLVEREMYDFAEGILMGAVLAADIPAAREVATRLAHKVVSDYQLPDGHFVTRVYRGGLRQTEPYLRWSQAPMFHALTTLLKTMEP